MLSTHNQKEEVCQSAGPVTIFDAVYLWDIVFDYVGAVFFCGLLPSISRMPEMALYLEHRSARNMARVQGFDKLAQLAEEIKGVEEKAKNDLTEKLKSLRAVKQLQLENEVKDAQERIRSAEEEIRSLRAATQLQLDNEAEEAREKMRHKVEEAKLKIQKAMDENKKKLLSSEGIIEDFIALMDQFIDLESKEELSLGPWWRRIQKRTEDRAQVMGVTFMFTFINMLVLASICIIIFAPVFSAAPYMIPLMQCGPGLILGILVAIPCGLFEIGEAEKSKDDALSSFSPELVSQFEQIKTVQTGIIDAKHEHSFADIEATNSLSSVTSAVQNCHAFFTSFIKLKEERAKNENEQVKTLADAHVSPSHEL